MILAAGAAAFLISLYISALSTPLSRRVAIRLGYLDVPSRLKAHAAPTPLLGGSAIFAAIVAPALLAPALATIWSAAMPAWVPREVAKHIPGLAMRAPMAMWILAGAAMLHIVGLIDDKRPLSAWPKLAAQVAVAIVVVVMGDVRVLTIAGGVFSCVVSVIWLVAITNAFNFLDNMDGLAAGVAAIVAAALLGAAVSVGQIFVSAWVCLVLGAVLGFLPYNFPPARTFMGDAGSLVIGYMLGVLSMLTTYVHEGEGFHAYSVFVPFVLMALPLYDMISVITLRIKMRRSPMLGDRRHFSHRLVKRGMSVRTAVLTIWLCTAATAISATLLPRVDAVGAVLIAVQTLAVLCVLALLEFGMPSI